MVALGSPWGSPRGSQSGSQPGEPVRWAALPWVWLAGAGALLLALVLTLTTLAGRALHFSRADRIAIMFCGSKKSLATVVPMAGVLFSASAAGFIIVPVILFHLIQLIVCAFIARREQRLDLGESGHRGRALPT